MPLIKDDALSEDSWVSVADDAPLPEDAPAIVSLERWQAEGETLRRRNAPLGIRLRSDQAPAAIADDVGRFAVIALEFPKFTDGRAYSYARLLRERYGYRGELRAVGNVLRDQALFLLRCGFDAFEVAEGTLPEAWRAARAAISVRYQPASDGGVPAHRLRRHRAEAEAPARRGREVRAGCTEECEETPSSRANAETSAPALAAAPAEACAGCWAY